MALLVLHFTQLRPPKLKTLDNSIPWTVWNGRLGWARIAALLVALLVDLLSGTLTPRLANAEAREKRPVPDYDGRPEQTDAGDMLLIVPRVVLAPAYVVSEYVIRKPLGWVTTAVEEEEVPEKLLEFFTFGENGETVVVPTALIDFGFGSNVGLYMRSRDLIVDGNRLSAHYGFGGAGWHTISVADRYTPAPKRHQSDQAQASDGGRPQPATWSVQVSGEYHRRLDGLFHGEGKTSSRRPTFFSYRRGELELRTNLAPLPGLKGELDLGLRTMHFRVDTRFGTSIEDRVQAAQMVAPTGLAGYRLLKLGTRWALDTREPRPRPGSGLRAVAHLNFRQGLQGMKDTRWLHLGGELGAYWDVSGAQHLIGLSLHVHDLIGGSGAIPFTELLEPSAMEILRGFRAGRLFGGSVTAAVMEYTWPVWLFIDGFIHGAVGNVFEQHFRDFALRDLRLSMGLGFRTTGSRDHALEMILGFGTETFDQGTRPELVRFMIGGTSAF